MLEPDRLRWRARLVVALTALVVACCTFPATAAAQIVEGGFALDQFDPAPAGDRFFGVQDAEAAGRSRLKLMVLGEYARDPLVLVRERDGQEDEELGAVVSDQLFVHVGAALSLVDRVNISLDFPLGVLDRGDTQTAGTQQFVAPEGVTIGDLRAGLRLRLLGVGPFQVGIGGYMWFPTGEERMLSGADGVRGSPQLLISGKTASFVYALNGGVRFGPELTYAGTTTAHQMVFGGAVGLLAAGGRLQIGPELYGNTEINGDDSFTADTTNLELLLGLKLRAGPIVVGGGAGPGLTNAIGTPSLRAVLSLAYAPASDDRDGDGVLDDVDACPTVPGIKSSDPAKNGCPEEAPDRDKDGILDAVDACPDNPGPRTDVAETNGCPDGDRDGIVDKVDACPTVKGVRSDDPKKNGCPDRDGDGIIDEVDACPTVKGVANEDPKKNGCPPDRDGDGITDPDDACPDLAGVADKDPAKNGCPPDTDGDGITDDKDACPKEKGPADPDPKRNGCPRVFVTETSIEILEQVQFKTGSDAILPASDDLLSNVAKVLGDHPEITRIQVEGHTDNKGAKPYNQNLSERRAASVKKWLVTRGKIDAARLESKGFGMDQPIDTNDTDAGRQKNRRVAFKILDKKAAEPKPAP